MQRQKILIDFLHLLLELAKGFWKIYGDKLIQGLYYFWCGNQKPIEFFSCPPASSNLNTGSGTQMSFTVKCLFHKAIIL